MILNLLFFLLGIYVLFASLWLLFLSITNRNKRKYELSENRGAAGCLGIFLSLGLILWSVCVGSYTIFFPLPIEETTVQYLGIIIFISLAIIFTLIGRGYEFNEFAHNLTFTGGIVFSVALIGGVSASIITLLIKPSTALEVEKTLPVFQRSYLIGGLISGLIGFIFVMLSAWIYKDYVMNKMLVAGWFIACLAGGIVTGAYYGGTMGALLAGFISLIGAFFSLRKFIQSFPLGYK